jgi:CBS domain-containing protein
MQCKDVMLTLVYNCREETTALECAQRMRDERVGFMPVLNGEGAVVGVVTDRDLVLRVIAADKPLTTPLRQVMSPGPFLTCAPEDDLRDLEAKMARTKKARALVRDNEKLVGVISLSDIAQFERSLRRTGKLMREVTHRESAAILRPPAP